MGHSCGTQCLLMLLAAEPKSISDTPTQLGTPCIRPPCPKYTPYGYALRDGVIVRVGVNSDAYLLPFLVTKTSVLKLHYSSSLFPHTVHPCCNSNKGRVALSSNSRMQQDANELQELHSTNIMLHLYTKNVRMCRQKCF